MHDETQARYRRSHSSPLVSPGLQPSRHVPQCCLHPSEQSAPGTRGSRAGAAADALGLTDAARLGGGANALVGMGAATLGTALRGRMAGASSLASVGPSDNLLKRVALCSTRSRA